MEAGRRSFPLFLLALLLRVAADPVQTDACSRNSGRGDGRCSREVLLSIIYITKRPGGYDVLFESLAQQTSKDFELICIDDTGPLDRETGLRAAPARRAAAVAYAQRRGVPLVALVPSKKKVRGLRFGQCNAINSGLVLSSGKFITVVQDNVWLLPNFVERTLAFFDTHDRDVLLSYPERRVAPPAGRLKREWMNDTSVLRIFEPAVEEDPVAAGWDIQNFNNTMTEDIWGQIGKDATIKTQWFECAACTASWELYAALNGLDEALDAGDDSQEANVKDRTVVLSERLKHAAARGKGGLLDPHQHRVLEQVLAGGAGLGETWNDLGTPVILIDHHQFESDETWARFERDTNVYRWRAIKDLMEFDEYPVPAPNAFNLATVRPHDHGVRAQALRADEHGVVDLVDWPRVLPALDVDEATMAQVWHVMKPRFGYKPEVLFVYAMSEDEQHVWEDGLTRALREMRRNFHMTLMNIGHLRIEEQPEIDFQMKNTFHFFLGYGRFLGHADYFMRKYNEVINPIKERKGEQLVRFALMLHGGQHFPDDEALELYGALLTDSQVQADELVADSPSLQGKIFSNLGIDPEHWTDADADSVEPNSLKATYDVVVVGDLTSATRPELLIQRSGTRLFMGRSVDASSSDIADELLAAGVQVVRWRNASQRALVYRSAAVVYFPMSEEGAGDRELLEALACSAAVEIEEDNTRLAALYQRSVQQGIPDHTSYAATLTQAVWSVLASGAAN